MRNPSATSQGTRIQWLHKKILNMYYPNAMRISERFNISHRQAQRDVDYLKNKLGAPIEYSAEHKGFYYTETKTTIRKEGGKEIRTVEKYDKYALPDTGAIHLLLKNCDPEWRNDDKATMDLKKQELEIKKQKADENAW